MHYHDEEHYEGKQNQKGKSVGHQSWWSFLWLTEHVLKIRIYKLEK